MSTTIPVECRPIIKGILGKNTHVHTAVAAKLYYAKPNPEQWTDVALVGALVLMTDTATDLLFLKLVDLDAEMVVWEFPLKRTLEYVQDLPYFHSFPGDDCMIGICFAKTPEAIQFYNLVHKKLSEKGAEPAAPKAATVAAKKSGGEKGRRPQIGAPVGFKHVSHVGFDPETGFSMENVPESWKSVFAQAGITHEQLQNKETATFIYDFMNKNVSPTTEERRPTPPSRPAPNIPKRPPPPPPVGHEPQTNKAPPSPPPPPRGTPHETPTSLSPPPPPPMSPTRESLMSSIRSAGLKSLRPTSHEQTPAPASPGAQSMSPSSSTDIMASLLKKALEDRSKHMSANVSKTGSDDDEW